jgi:hypothetical protein
LFGDALDNESFFFMDVLTNVQRALVEMYATQKEYEDSLPEEVKS